MRTCYFILLVFAVAANTFIPPPLLGEGWGGGLGTHKTLTPTLSQWERGQERLFVRPSTRSIAKLGGDLPSQSSSENEIGVVLYPQSTYLPQATARLLETKTASWLLARVYHTDASVKDVAKHFKSQAPKGNKPAPANAILESLLRDNWKITKRPLSSAAAVFGVGAELRKSTTSAEAETTFGVIVLDDSIVRVHLITPHSSDADNNKLTTGTMIVLIREGLPEPSEPIASDSDAGTEKVYSAREVTRSARVKKKPNPDYVTHIKGTVVLRAVFRASGKVTNIKVVSGLPGGLTEASVEAARKIIFEPAIKDGRYVSVFVQLEYNFHP